MGFSMSSFDALGPILGSALAVVILAALIRVSGAIRYIGNTRVAIVERLWSPKGSLKGGLIALAGEAGFQPDVLRGGLHLFFPFQYRLHMAQVMLGRGLLAARARLAGEKSATGENLV